MDQRYTPFIYLAIIMTGENFSPINKIEEIEFEKRGITLLIKRDDLLHGPCQGNKFRKLKYHLSEFSRSERKRILTFGGAFSNHLYATAAAGHQLNIPTIGLVRGEIDEKNPTVKKIRAWNMDLIPVHRSDYQKKDGKDFLTFLHESYPDAYIVPEGGHHQLAQRGVSELVHEIRTQYTNKINTWVCPYGTGSTALGIIKALTHEETLRSYVVLKGFDLEKTKNQLVNSENISLDYFELIHAHFGGYGKQCPEVENFILDFYSRYHILLDPIYTGKMMHQLYKDIFASKIKEGATIMVVHTGGLQGISGYNYRYGTKLPEWDPKII